MKIAVPREIAPAERRVALVPETVARLVKSGSDVVLRIGRARMWRSSLAQTTW